MRAPDYLRVEIEQVRQRIGYCRAMVLAAPCSASRMYYQDLLMMEVDQLLGLVDHLQLSVMSRSARTPLVSSTHPQGVGRGERQKVFTKEELAQYDGSGGKPAYVAVNGIVYDMSLEPTWGGGTHFSLYAGQDLTPQFQGCHEGMEAILQKLPKVGVLQS